MKSLEDRLRPPTVSRPWPRDVLWLALLIALAAVLVPSLHVDWAGLVWAAPGEEGQVRQAQAYQEAFSRVTRRMASAYLPMAMGMLLCLRCGAIDLSVWAVSSLAGVLAAQCILAGAPAWAGFVAGVLAGAAVGGLNALLAARGRLPSLLATLLTGLVALWVLHAWHPQRQIALPDAAFNRWHVSVPVPVASSGGPELPAAPAPGQAAPSMPEPAQPEGASQPLYLTRMLLAVGAYSLAMVVLMVFDWVGPKSWDRGGRGALAWALAASGALAGAGGVLWLLDAGAAPVATRLVGDLTVPVAAILAGGAFLAGRGRTLLAGVFLPGSLLLASLWKGEFQFLATIVNPAGLPLEWQGYSLQLAILACMVLLVHAAASGTARPRVPITPRALAPERRAAGRLAPLIACLLAIAGIALVGGGASANLNTGRWFQSAGLAVWLAGGVIMIVHCRCRETRGKPGTDPGFRREN